MHKIKTAFNTPNIQNIILGLYLFVFLACGIYTELRLITVYPIPKFLFLDFGIYERALNDALKGRDPYAILSIGRGYLYPPQALLIIEIFSHIKSFYMKVSLFSTMNIALMVLMVHGVARQYGQAIEKTWYWYVLCLGFAPFLELMHVGQINVITLFGLFMLFIWEDKSPILSGLGLGLAVITKVSPIFFLIYLFVNKRFKVMAVALAVIGLFTGLSILRYGLPLILEYPKTFVWLLNQLILDSNSQSLAARLAGLPFSAASLLMIQRIVTFYILLVIVISGLFSLFGKQPREPLFIVTALGMMLSPNVLWYHHYVFILLPLLIWTVWSGFDRRVVIWCLAGLLIIQIDRQLLTHGLLIHIFGQLSMLWILVWQARQFFSRKKANHTGPSLEGPSDQTVDKNDSQFAATL